MKMKSPASFSSTYSSVGPYSCRTRPSRMYSITSKSTWMCAAATPPGGMVATFIESCFASTFFADRPVLYWIPFHPRTAPPPRMTKIPAAPSTAPTDSLGVLSDITASNGDAGRSGGAYGIRSAEQPPMEISQGARVQRAERGRPQHADVQHEQVLARQLSAPQQALMALGGAIGTGLFLASGLAVNVAGPAIILSYMLIAGLSLLLGSALAEMAVAHPTAGAFGVYAGMYLSPFAGYAVRV